MDFRLRAGRAVGHWSSSWYARLVGQPFLSCTPKALLGSMDLWFQFWKLVRICLNCGNDLKALDDTDEAGFETTPNATA